ncbi:FAD:protein FMN transferase [Thiothrix lacustris]|uniref:FAD:protein FMN transferase n=1 Tax=Thiothrix lacustris TaxID=525917 RepID=A0ABY9MLU7_9GAMM|nr:FAD:protein FMN transferase [Thiothrix lacustris]WML89635.1 FAD:protein FMN transferase [Thiothrix lacustris]
MIVLLVHPVLKQNLLNRLRGKTLAFGLVFCFGVLFLAACDKSSQAGVRLEGMQGTALWHVTVTHSPVGISEAELLAGLSKTFADTNQLLATWDDTSEIARFNHYQRTDWFSISPELAKLLDLTLNISRQSGGVYDVTVGPLIKLWGFSSHDVERDAVPAKAEIDQALAKVGYQKLQVRFDPPAVRKSQVDLRVELASVADGFAADQAGLYLESLGIHEYMVEIAGEVRTRGLSPRGDPWHIAIEKPVEEGRIVQKGLHLQNSGLATSGDYRNYFVQGGKRYSHTFNPVTGTPVTHNLASVSVVSEEATLADAYATLFMALGEEKGKAFAEAHAINAYFIWRTDDGFETANTVGFQRLFTED